MAVESPSKEGTTVQTFSTDVTVRVGQHDPWWNSQTLYAVVIALIIAISFWTGAARRSLNFDNSRIDVEHVKATDVDYHMLYPSIEAKQSFLQTFQWWKEPWRADQWVGAYWRPLSMQAWWMESHLFGEDRPANWIRVSLLLSILFDLLLVAFVRAFTGNKWLALASLAIFALPPWWLHIFSPLTALPRISNADVLIAEGWKDQPDLWANCLILGALLFSLREKWVLALGCASLAVAFKESGLIAFPLVPILMFSRRRLTAIPLWVYGASLGMLVLMMYARWLAGPLVFRFHSYGSNAGGTTRYANAMLPLGFSAFSSIGQVACGIGVFSLLILRPKRPLVWLVALVSIFLVSVLCVAAQERLSIDVAFAQLILLGTAPVALLMLWLGVGATVSKEKPLLKTATTFAVLGYVAAVPFALATQAALHCLALAEAFLAAYGACATLAVVLFLIDRYAERWPQVAAFRDQLRSPVMSNDTSLEPVTFAFPTVPSRQA